MTCDPPPPDAELEAATDWLMRLRDAPDDPALRAAFEGWLAGGPGRARAWEQARAAWELLGAVPPHSAARWPARPAPRRRRVPAGAAVAVAAVALAATVVLAVMPSPLVLWRADHRTAAGVVERVMLADGTAVHLAPRSAIAERFTAGRRGVALLEGEAFFEVAPDPERPFAVEAGALTVTVLGTAFDVRSDGTTPTVTVRHGAVAVRNAGGDGEGGDGEGEDGGMARLGPGDRAVLDAATGRIRVDRVAADDVGAWRDGRLFVADAAVADVVAALRRFGDGWILVADDALARRRVTGLFDLTDTERALRALVEPTGGRVVTVTPLLHILLPS